MRIETNFNKNITRPRTGEALRREVDVEGGGGDAAQMLVVLGTCGEGDDATLEVLRQWLTN